MTIAVYGRPVNTSQVAFAENVLNILTASGCQVLIHKQYYEFLKSGQTNFPDIPVFETHEELKGRADFLFSIGGDGTLLDTVLLVINSKIPIAGVNAGRLGFLSSISKENVSLAVDALAKGHYSVDSRTLLKVESNHPVFNGNNIALNDFTIHKMETSSMIKIHTYLNGEYLNSYWADGLIIATPTGSTGYSLSCGGPIIVSDKNVISLEVEGRSQNFMATLDSRSSTIDSSFQLAVKKEDYCVNLVRLSNENFLGTLRSKLNWGLDSRN